MDDVIAMLETARKDVGELRSQLDIARGQLAVANQELDTMRSQVQITTNEVLSLRERIGPTETELHARITNLTSERDTLTTQLNASNTELVSLRQNLDAANLNIARLTASQTGFDERVAGQVGANLMKFGVRKTALNLPGADDFKAAHAGRNWTNELMAEKARRAQQGEPAK